LHIQIRTSTNKQNVDHVNVKGKQLQIKYYNPEHIDIQLLESTNSTSNILRDDCNNKQSLITESVAMTQIDIHHAGEEPDQHTIRLTPVGCHI
jgi:hypothetical protein